MTSTMRRVAAAQPGGPLPPHASSPRSPPARAARASRPPRSRRPLPTMPPAGTRSAYVPAHSLRERRV
eukprot:3922213-Pleurochrysis_carterae.AAC.1